MLTGLLMASVLATFAGGFFPLSKFLSRQGLWRLFAFRSGILISVTFTDLLPEAWLYHPSWAGWGALFGFLLFYAAESLAMTDACPEYLENCTTHSLGAAALAGLFIHSLLDGVNLAVSFAAGSAAGMAAGTALCLHKVADGLTLTSLFKGAGYSRRQTQTALLTVAIATPAGAALVQNGTAAMGAYATAALLGLASGSFLYIGAREILPRMHRDGDVLTLVFFGAGVAAMAALHRLAGG
jgi:zinc transporter ZupT